jgi:hypothetical protein
MAYAAVWGGRFSARTGPSKGYRQLRTSLRPAVCTTLKRAVNWLWGDLSLADEVNRREHQDEADDYRQPQQQGGWPRRVIRRSLVIVADIRRPGE